MNNLSDVRIDIGGTRVTIFQRISIQQWIDRHHTFELSVPIEQVEGEGAMRIDRSREFIGKEISVTIQYRVGSGQPFVFKGFITQLYLSKQSVSGSAVVIRGFSASILLEQGSRYAAFHQKNHSDIVKTVLDEYDTALLRPNVSPRNNQTEQYVVKFDESSYNFLHRLAAATGNWFFYDGERVVFGDVSNTTPIDLRYGDDISAFDMRMDLPGGEFYFDDFNYIQNQQARSHSAAVSVTGLGDYGQFLIDKAEQLYAERLFDHPPLPVWTDAEARQQVSYAKKASVANAVIFSGSCNVIGLKVGSVIDIRERSSQPGSQPQSYGRYRITSISHEANLGGGYSNRFEAVPAGVEFRANPGFYRPRATTQLAKVTHNDDPEHLGRVRVLFFWQLAQKDDESSPWIRVLTSYTAHADQGHYFVPERNSLVMVSFENDDPARPLVAGVTYHKDTKMNAFYSDQNNYKAIITKGGNHIIINDEAGKEEISLYNKDKKNHIQLSLDGTHISVKTQGTLNLQAGTINMKAKKINVEAEDELNAKSEQIKLEANSSLFAEAQSKIRLSGTSEAILTGAEVLVSADVKATVKGKITAVSADASLDLSSSAVASLSGMPVKIN
ncbi:type VI secretion system Vgr family protein [Spirosoma montaniterrae]|uniref:Gp5/Type VI secretion system Vgr protein OB-fold domain-containing protein n=1 Tax=Spirosoma montaniterrae TaxID=1178516 RepID=A0A1P9WYT0_9BACT|nr:type VI secretion system Vgr family protein [Spirosoma montaniterrae]AQG80535.1 hypothetical protein AWR27_15115 [Spirosoma montaniterrae]